VDRLIQAEEVGVFPYFDFHVPDYECYWAEGFFHHNTGKTLSSRIIRNQAKGSFIWVSARDFHKAGSVGGVGLAFELAREIAPSVIVFEDVDNWLYDTTIDLMKTEMDGIARSSGVLTILTTNFPERLPDTRCAADSKPIRTSDTHGRSCRARSAEPCRPDRRPARRRSYTAFGSP